MSSLTKSMTMPEPRRNYIRERATLTLQPRGARQRSPSGEFPANIDGNKFPGPTSMKKVTPSPRARALPALPPITDLYTVSSTQSARRIRPLPTPASSLPPTSSFTSLSSPLSLSPLSSSPLSSSPVLLSLSSPLAPLSSSPTSLTLLTPLTPLTPTLPTPTSPKSPILFASRTMWVGVDDSSESLGFVRRNIRRDSDEDEGDTVTLAEEPGAYQQNNRSTHHRWKSIWRQPTQDPPKKWVKETAKGQRMTVHNYANVLDALRAL